MARNTPNLGQRTAKSSGSGRVVPQGQGVVNVSKGGPSPAANLAKHTQGKNGKTTVNSQPAK